jgi:hypothetical protein
MTTQEVKAAIRESLGLPAKPEHVPTVPQEGHVCDFPIWSYSKHRAQVTRFRGVSHLLHGLLSRL